MLAVCPPGTAIDAEEAVGFVTVKSVLDQEKVGFVPCVPEIPEVRVEVAPSQTSEAAGVIDAIQAGQTVTSNDVASDRLQPLSSV